MESNKIRITIEDPADKEVESKVIKFPGECKFNNLPPGSYRTYGYWPSGEKQEAEPKGLTTLKFSKNTITVTVKSEKKFISTTDKKMLPPEKYKDFRQKQRAPVKAIILSAVGVSLLSHFGGIQPLTQEIKNRLLSPNKSTNTSQVQSNKNQISSRPIINDQYNNFFSKDVETRLRKCIQKNFAYLSGIPTLSSLLSSMNWSREPNSEFERQILFYYTKFRQFEATISNCDPTLTLEILSAQDQIGDSMDWVLVIGKVVNVRTGPSMNEDILGQVRYGRILVVDRDAFTLLSQAQKSAIKQGLGWQPVFLPDGRNGYIYGLYTDPIVP